MSDPRRRLTASFRDAFRGVWDAVKSERNMRIHLVACAYVLFFASRLSLTRGEWACLFLAMGAVMAAELLNTSVEKLCDFTERRYSPHIRVVKDMAAGAVLLSAVFAALTGAVIFLRPALLDVLKALALKPLTLGILLLTLAAAVVFIVLGPEGVGRKIKERK